MLKEYQLESDRLLQTLARLLERDPHVRAAWLADSFGRREEDALSDYDLWVAVDDAH